MNDGKAALRATESDETDEGLSRAREKEKKEKEYWDNLSSPEVGRSDQYEVESIRPSRQETATKPSPIKNSDREVVVVNVTFPNDNEVSPQFVSKHTMGLLNIFWSRTARTCLYCKHI